MPQNKVVTLALQGGGSHGAFTWGVLDRLLEDGRIDVEAISGASAGAVNAVVLAHGYVKGGRDGAREALAQFWRRVSAKAPFNFTRASPSGTAASPPTRPSFPCCISAARATSSWCSCMLIPKPPCRLPPTRFFPA